MLWNGGGGGWGRGGRNRGVTLCNTLCMYCMISHEL